MTKCTYCNKEIVLAPSASERAKKYGGKPSDYTKLFTMHADCLRAYRNDDKAQQANLDKYCERG